MSTLVSKLPDDLICNTIMPIVYSKLGYSDVNPTLPAKKSLNSLVNTELCVHPSEESILALG